MANDGTTTDGIDTLTLMNRLLRDHGWKSKLDLDDLETGRVPIYDWTHPDIPGVTIATWKKKDVAWWADKPGVSSDSIQELADLLKELSAQQEPR
jgi:hypothetical protein